jgi:hypothetical protein
MAVWLSSPGERIRVYGLSGPGAHSFDFAPACSRSKIERARGTAPAFGARRAEITNKLVEDQYGGRYYRSPQGALVPDCGLRHVSGAYDFVGETVDLFLFIP